MLWAAECGDSNCTINVILLQFLPIGFCSTGLVLGLSLREKTRGRQVVVVLGIAATGNDDVWGHSCGLYSGRVGLLDPLRGTCTGRQCWRTSDVRSPWGVISENQMWLPSGARRAGRWGRKKTSPRPESKLESLMNMWARTWLPHREEPSDVMRVRRVSFVPLCWNPSVSGVRNAAKSNDFSLRW